MWWTAGLGLWAAAWVFSGRLRVTVTPSPHGPGGRHDVCGVEMVQRAVGPAHPSGPRC